MKQRLGWVCAERYVQAIGGAKPGALNRKMNHPSLLSTFPLFQTHLVCGCEALSLFEGQLPSSCCQRATRLSSFCHNVSNCAWVWVVPFLPILPPSCRFHNSHQHPSYCPWSIPIGILAPGAGSWPLTFPWYPLIAASQAVQ